MKKISILVLGLFLVGGMIIAEEGFSAGAELGISDFEEVSENMFIRPYASYGFGGYDPYNGLDFYAELGLPYGFGEWLGFGLDLNLALGYKLELYSGFFRFFAENWTYFSFSEDYVMISTLPPFKYYSYQYCWETESWLALGVQYTHFLDFGDVYGRIDMPFSFYVDGADIFDYAELNITLGVNFESGFGAGLTAFTYIGYGESKFFNMIGPFIIYNSDFFNFGFNLFYCLDSGERSYAGTRVRFEAGYYVTDNLKIYAGLPISYINSDYYDTAFGLTIGAKYTF